jgi:8-oxo-dGTP pyrophosphatase MutT (NUDIX family)
MKTNLINQLKSYEGFNELETKMKFEMLNFIEKNDDCFERSLEIGHITASCFVINQEFNKILLMHHSKLNKWLQPGGHCDGESDTRKVALKELFEETGLKPLNLFNGIFDIDIHFIPERKNVKEHLHYDIRHLVVCSDSTALIINGESRDLKWLKTDQIIEYTNEESILRMLNKISIYNYF